MALQVWLPLNGDLRNLGLSDLKFSVLGSYTTVDNEGKIGKCYKNSTYGQGGIISNKTITLPVTLSWFCWINFSSLGTSSELNGVVSNHMPTSTPANMGITIKYLTSTTGKLSCSTGDGTNRTFNTYTGNTTLTAGVWYHIGFTYNGSKIKFYVNGVLDGETSYANQSQIAAKIGIFAWNMSRSSPYGYAVPGKLNDFRIYDHCLSEDEIHELSLGKVGHWKLNDYEISRSGLTSVTWNLLILNGNLLSGWTADNSTLTLDNGYIAVTKQGNGGYAGIARKPWSYTNHIYYIAVTCYSATTDCPVGIRFLNGVSSGDNIRTSTTSSTPVRISATGTIDSSVTGLALRVGNADWANGSKGYFKDPICVDLTQMFGSGNEPTAELFEEMFPLHYYPYDAGTVKNLKTTIPDISGYHNDLTITGTVNLINDSKRYNKSIQFPASAASKLTVPLTIDRNAWTISFWEKCDWTNVATSGPYILYWGSYIRIRKYSTTGRLRSLYYYANSENSQASILTYFMSAKGTDTSWKHFVLTFNGSVIRAYLNGTQSASSTLPSGFTLYDINNKTLALNYTAETIEKLLSDVRIYATALSADDVLKLYKLGNV